MPLARIVNIDMNKYCKMKDWFKKIIIDTGSKEVNSSSESLTMTLF